MPLVGMQFRGCDLRRLPLAEVDHVGAALGGLLVGVVHARVVAIDRGGNATETVLQRERHTAIGMILELGHANEHVGVFVGLVHHVLGVHVRRAGNFEARVLLALAEPVGVFEFHAGGGGLQGAKIPAGIEHHVFQRSRRGPGAFHETYALRSGAAHQVRRGAHYLGMRVVCQPERHALKALAGCAGHVHLHGDGLVADQLFQSAELVEHGAQSSPSRPRRKWRIWQWRQARQAPPRRAAPAAKAPPKSSRSILYESCYCSSLTVAQMPTRSTSTPHPSSVLYTSSGLSAPPGVISVACL